MSLELVNYISHRANTDCSTILRYRHTPASPRIKSDTTVDNARLRSNISSYYTSLNYHNSIHYNIDI